MDKLDLPHYVEQARKSGMNDNQIRQGLLQSGWPVSDVEEALAKAPALVSPQPRPKAMMSKSLAVGLFLAIVIVAGYLAAAFSMSLWPFSMTQPSVTPTPTPAVVTAWETYRHDGYGFEIKYPENWCVRVDREFIEFYSSGQCTNVTATSLPDIVLAINYDEGDVERENVETVMINSISFTHYQYLGYPNARHEIYTTMRSGNLFYFDAWQDVGKTYIPQILGTFRFTK